MDLQTTTVEGPMEKYFKKHPIPTEKTLDLSEEINDFLFEKSSLIFDDRNPFLREEDMIEVIERFEAMG
jgi:hypothetical protein